MTTAVEGKKLAGPIEREHAAAIGSAKKALEHAVECGRLLCEAKAAVGYGRWEEWAEKHLSFGPRQARKYMALYNRREDLLRHQNSDLTIEGALEYLRDIGEDHSAPVVKITASGTAPAPVSRPQIYTSPSIPQRATTAVPIYPEPVQAEPEDAAENVVSLSSLPAASKSLVALQLFLSRLEEAREIMGRDNFMPSEIRDQFLKLLHDANEELYHRQITRREP